MNQNINILIVEDEFITLDNLKENIEDLGYGIAGTAMRAEQAITILEEGKTDFAILDIHLRGDRDGIWLAEQIQEKYHIPFIFLTAFTDRATVKRAAATLPANYLVKPFSPSSIFAAIEVALTAFQQTSFLGEGRQASPYIFIKEDKVYKKLFLADIYYVEACKNYLEIHLENNRHIIRSTLKEFMEQLPPQHFIQVHRSFVVNKHFVESISGQYLLIEGQSIPITKAFRMNILAHFKIS